MIRLSASLQKVLQGIPDGACVSDARGRVLYLNPAAEALLGVSRAKAVGKTLCGMLCARFADAEQRCSAAHCPLRRGSREAPGVTIEGRFAPAAKKEDIALSVRCLRLARPGRTPAGRLTLLSDVTPRALAEKQREDWRSMVVHDLRAPLTNIYAALREMQLDAAGASRRPADPETLDIAVRNCRRMTEMLELYLAVTRFDACMMPVKKTGLDVGGLLRECVREQSAVADERNISVKVDASAGLTALGDPQLLSRALQNLLNNALKFSPPGGRVTITARRDAAGRAVIAIRDSGPGIDPRDGARIFDRYAQAGGLRRREGAGTGLGLPFCRQAVAAMRGELTVASHPGGGSTFTIALKGARG